MKKIALIMCLVLIISAFAACGKNKTLPDGETELFNTEEEAYEAMTGAAEEGNYKSAIAYYGAFSNGSNGANGTNSNIGTGAAGADKQDVRDWYLYAMAMDAYNEYNCIGYPLDMLSEKINSDFEPAKEIIEELRNKTKDFNDIYYHDGKYVYICDGKIGTSVDTLITDFLFCAYEISIKDDVFFWTQHNQDGTHTDLYTIKKENNQLIVEATENNEQDIFSGTYDIFVAEMPMLCY